MSGTIPPLPQYAFMAWCLVKAQGQLYLLPCIIPQPCGGRHVTTSRENLPRNAFTNVK